MGENCCQPGAGTCLNKLEGADNLIRVEQLRPFRGRIETTHLRSVSLKDFSDLRCWQTLNITSMACHQLPPQGPGCGTGVGS